MLSRRDFLRLLGGGAIVFAAGWAFRSPLGRLLSAAGRTSGAGGASGAGPGGGAGTAAGRGRRHVKPGSERPAGAALVLALLSDTHVQDPAHAPAAAAVNGKVAAALADLAAVRPDLCLIDGDTVDNGLAGEYEALGKLLQDGLGASPAAGWARARVVATTGNHEFYDPAASDEDTLRRFTAHFGYGRPYQSLVLGDLHLVLLADEMRHRAPSRPEWAWLSQAQVQWFASVLKQHRDLDTVVCLHQPLQDTVAWSFGGGSFAGCGQAAELKSILAANPQVKLWLSGHTHLPLEAVGQVNRVGGVTFAALGSTFYQFPANGSGGAATPGRGGWSKDFDASQSRVLEVYKDRLVLRARDHREGAWLDGLTVTIPRGRNPGPPPP